MSVSLKENSELYEIYKAEVQGIKPDLTDFSAGSINDVMAGAACSLAEEFNFLLLQLFNKTFFRLADDADLDALAVDHFGDTFARPGKAFASGIVTFSRANLSYGTVVIPSGAIVKTRIDANGQTKRYQTTQAVTITSYSINAPVICLDGGVQGNCQAGDIAEIESTLLDPTLTVSNTADISGGAEIPNDESYREIILNKILSLKGASAPAIVAIAKSVNGVVTATPIEKIVYVKEWDVVNDEATGDYFRIVRPILYVADANGSANVALLDQVKEAVRGVRAYGVVVDVVGATALEFNWSASISLNPEGPNYEEFASSTQRIVDTMTAYIQSIPIGTTFNRLTANNYIKSIWPTDLLDFSTTIPTGNVVQLANQKFVPGAVAIV